MALGLGAEPVNHVYTEGKTMTFVLPEELPATVAELDALLDDARKSINVIQARRAAGEELTREDVDSLRGLLDAVDTLTSARGEAATAEQVHADEVNALLERASAATEPEVVAEAPEIEAPAEAGEPVAEPEVVVAASGDPVIFAGAGADSPPDVTRAPGWEMDPSCPGYRPGMGKVGFREIAAGIDSLKPGSRKALQPNKPAKGGHLAQVLARIQRPVDSVVGDSHALVAAIAEATDERRLPGHSLVASLTAASNPGVNPVAAAGGGWCAPSEQLYDFCGVPNATDLISVPEFAMSSRGGIRWPVEPDLSGIFESFLWNFTEAQLEAVDSGTGEPTAVKECVQIPCPDEFEEIRLEAIGWCVEAGILQTQGWPELIQWFMESLTQKHLQAVSLLTILRMVAGSTVKTVQPDTQIGTVSSVLNAIALQAYNLRDDRGLARGSTIELVAPNWLPEVIRADLAMTEGLDTKAVSDGQITAWFAARNIAPQFVGQWQAGSGGNAGAPGDLNCVEWPTSVNVLMYPSGTWFRSMAPVIELGVQYPRELLQYNRYTRFFTEDSFALGKRCNHSLNVSIPICVNGAISDRVGITCGTEGSLA